VSLEDTSKLVIGDLVTFGPVLVLEFVFEGEAVNFDFVPQAFYELLEFLAGSHRCRSLVECEFLHLVGGVVDVTRVHALQRVVLQDLALSDGVDQVFVVDVIVVFLVLEVRQK